MSKSKVSKSTKSSKVSKKSEKSTKTSESIVKGFKGYSNKLQCQDNFQYEIDKSYSIPEDEVKICQKGFHFCENPLDVFSTIPPQTVIALPMWWALVRLKII